MARGDLQVSEGVCVVYLLYVVYLWVLFVVFNLECRSHCVTWSSDHIVTWSIDQMVTWSIDPIIQITGSDYIEKQSSTKNCCWVFFDV